MVITENDDLHGEYDIIGKSGKATSVADSINRFAPNLQSYESDLYTDGGGSSMVVRSSRHRQGLFTVEKT